MRVIKGKTKGVRIINLEIRKMLKESMRKRTEKSTIGQVIF